MRPMGISKMEGILISLFIISIYTSIFFFWSEDVIYLKQLTGIFFLGMIFIFLDKIEPGTQEEILFFHKSTNKFWDDGLCLVPSILPIVHYIGMYPLWSLKKKHIRNQLTERPDVPQIKHDVSIHHDGTLHQLQTNVPFWAMIIGRIIAGLFKLIFSVNRENPELIFQGIGTKIILITILVSACMPYEKVLTFESQAGQCFTVPANVKTKVVMHTKPRQVPNALEKVEIISPVKNKYSWGNLLLILDDTDDTGKMYSPPVEIIINSSTGGEMCF